MAIKDKDGNIYRIQSPNPVMKEQEVWDKSKLKLINFTYADEIVQNDGETIIKDILNKNGPRNKKDIENVLILNPEPIIKKKTLPKPEEPIIAKEEPVIVKETIKAPKTKSENSRTSGEQPTLYDQSQLEKIKQRKINIYCLPVFDREVKDDVYEEVYKIKSYGDKFTFEGIMVEEEDLFCRFWTNTRIPEYSIVYPRNHSRRWWKVEELKSVDEGFMIYAVLTNANPDFTD